MKETGQRYSLAPIPLPISPLPPKMERDRLSEVQQCTSSRNARGSRVYEEHIVSDSPVPRPPRRRSHLSGGEEAGLQTQAARGGQAGNTSECVTSTAQR